MTRINLVPPEELSDQHLVAEYREIFMVGSSLQRSLRSPNWEKTKKWYPDAFLAKYDGDDKRVPKDEIAMIGPEFSTLCRQFLYALTTATGLDSKPICEDNNVYPVNDAAKFSIVGHHNISAKKWDVIPWAQSLYYSIDY